MRLTEAFYAIKPFADFQGWESSISRDYSMATLTIPQASGAGLNVVMFAVENADTALFHKVSFYRPGMIYMVCADGDSVVLLTVHDCRAAATHLAMRGAV